MLTPDELGEKGETRFRELCVDAKLICNKSDRDRTGWDFLVEGAFDDVLPISLDKRGPALAAHVQVKTVSNKAKPIQLKLNMAERLAKELKPSFICVIVVKDDLIIEEAFLIHITGQRLSHILKALRRYTATGDSRPMNKVFISITPAKSERVEPSGNALKAALQAACGTNLFSYSADKEKLIKSLGYAGRPFKGNMSFAFKDSNDLEDVFLGLREVDVVDFKAFETRFGIELPEFASNSARISIKPKARDKCRISVRSALGAKPVSMDGEFYHVPGALTGGASRYHIRSELLTIDFKLDAATFKIPPLRSASLNKWRQFWELLSIISEPDGIVEIKRFSSPPGGILSLPISRTDPLSFSMPPAKCSSLAKSLFLIIETCGEELAEEFEWNSLIKVESEIALLAESLTKPFEFSFPGNEAALKAIPEKLQILICNQFSLAGFRAAYCLKADLSSDKELCEFTVANITYLHVSRIEETEGAFVAYQNWAKKQFAIEHLCQMKASLELLPVSAPALVTVRPVGSA